MKQSDTIKSAVDSRNGFDLSFDGVLSQEWGDIVPIVCKEMIPGDSFTCDASAFVRLAPLASPTYGRIHGYINYFFVPNRILLENNYWEDFIRGGSTGKVNISLPTIPVNSAKNVYTAGNFTNQEKKRFRKLWTYLGLPDPKILNTGDTTPADSFALSLLPFMAYNRIYGDYFYPWGVDENGDTTAETIYFRRLPRSRSYNFVPDGGGFAQFNSYLGRDFFLTKRACFKKDYLTTAQISPQRGNIVVVPDMVSPVQPPVSPDNVDVADGGTSVTPVLGVNWAQNLQKYFERNNIAGARYFEQILARYGVKIPAERLDRSEYLGGTDFWINVSDVTSTAQTEGATLGEMAGKGVGLGQSGISYNAVDFGFFIATLHLMPESGCPQGLSRMWSRQTRFDYFTPEFQTNGMQPIYNAEVWAEGSITTDRDMQNSGVFGYIPRYAEYKYSQPLLAGDFRMDFSDSGTDYVDRMNDMASMHLYRMFYVGSGDDQNDPVLSPEFCLLENVNAFNRIFQDTNNDYDHFWVNIQVKLGAMRPMDGYLDCATSYIQDEKGGRVMIPVFGMRL